MDVGFIQHLPINQHLPIIHPHSLSRQADYAFNIILIGVARLVKNKNIPARKFAKLVGHFRNDDKLAPLKSGHHAVTIHAHARRDGVNNNKQNRRQQQRFDNIQEEAFEVGCSSFLGWGNIVV